MPEGQSSYTYFIYWNMTQTAGGLLLFAMSGVICAKQHLLEYPFKYSFGLHEISSFCWKNVVSYIGQV